MKSLTSLSPSSTWKVDPGVSAGDGASIMWYHMEGIELLIELLPALPLDLNVVERLLFIGWLPTVLPWSLLQLRHPAALHLSD